MMFQNESSSIIDVWNSFIYQSDRGDMVLFGRFCLVGDLSRVVSAVSAVLAVSAVSAVSAVLAG